MMSTKKYLCWVVVALMFLAVLSGGCGGGGGGGSGNSNSSTNENYPQPLTDSEREELEQMLKEVPEIPQLSSDVEIEQEIQRQQEEYARQLEELNTGDTTAVTPDNPLYQIPVDISGTWRITGGTYVWDWYKQENNSNEQELLSAKKYTLNLQEAKNDDWKLDMEISKKGPGFYTLNLTRKVAESLIVEIDFGVDMDGYTERGLWLIGPYKYTGNNSYGCDFRDTEGLGIAGAIVLDNASTLRISQWNGMKRPSEEHTEYQHTWLEIVLTKVN